MKHLLTKPEADLGFGNKTTQESPERFINKDGSFNIVRKGVQHYRLINIYSNLIAMSWFKFGIIVILYYTNVNLFFTFLYLLVGVHHLSGIEGNSFIDKFLDAFFFSAQTLTTVGYGRISPEGLPANIVASLEALLGVLVLAIATGVCYGRFAKPNARIAFSKNMIIAPYQDVTALEFKIANLRNNQLIDVEVILNYSYLETNKEGNRIRKYKTLELERSSVNFFPLSWTIVHPINEDSPLWEVSEGELAYLDAEFMILIKAVDDTFAQQVHVRSSYKFNEIIFNAKFNSIFDKVENGQIILELDRIDEFQKL
jgi:inward rectifier potassium channel